MSLKKYPSCYCTHKPLDGLLALRAAHGLRPDQVASITVSMSQRNALTLRHHQPRTGLQGKFSIARLAAAVSERWGKLDFLVLNAAMLGTLAPVPAIDGAEFAKLFTLNVTAHVETVCVLVPENA